MSFEEVYQFAKSHDRDALIEGEIAGRTSYLMHIPKDDAEKVIKTLKDSFGAHVFDVHPPEEWHTLTEEQLSHLTDEQKEKYEEAKDKTLFRFYIPPTADEDILCTTEVYEKLVDGLNSVLKLDPKLVTRMMFTQFQCDETILQNHPTLRGNVVKNSGGEPVPVVSLWGLLNAVIDHAFGERVTYATEQGMSTLHDLVSGEDVIKLFLRTTK